MDFEQLSIFTLRVGKHSDAEDGVCAMEAVAWLEGLPHSDAPECTCPVIASYVRTINDRMPVTPRQEILSYLPRLVGTVSREHELQRAHYFAWNAITVIVPNILEKAGRAGHAEALRKLPFHDWQYAGDAVRAAASAASGSRASASTWAYASAAYASSAARAAARNWAAAAAGYAAASVSAAASGSDGDAWGPALQLLDGALAIGPQSAGFSKPVEERIIAYRELVKA